MHRLRPILRFPTSMFYGALHNHDAPLNCRNSQNSDGVGLMASLLSSRAVVRFRGHETLKFLHGLLTNDVRRFGDQTKAAPPLYALLLTPHGRFLYDMFVYRPNGSDPEDPFELFMDVDSSMADEFLETLKKYRLRSGVEIDNMAGEFSCWQCYGGIEQLCEAVECAKWKWFRDPRLACLGFRGIFPRDTTPPLVEACKVVDEKNYLLWRVEHGVAEGSSEIAKGEAFPLEYNLAALNAISFDKGCYVGQELVARTHHRGVIRKRLFPLKFLDGKGREAKEGSVAAGLEVINMASGKKAGAVCAVFGCSGLGVLRCDDAVNGDGTLCIQGQEGVNVIAIKPKWWPPHWFQEHQEHTRVDGSIE